VSRKRASSAAPADWNRELLRFPQDGRVSQAAGPIQKVHVADDELDRYSFGRRNRPGGWRKISSRTYRSTRFSAIPVKATYFDRTAKRFCSRLRAGFNIVGLRCDCAKASRELVDEVKQFHFVFSKARLQPVFWRGEG